MWSSRLVALNVALNSVLVLAAGLVLAACDRQSDGSAQGGSATGRADSHGEAQQERRAGGAGGVGSAKARGLSERLDYMQAGTPMPALRLRDTTGRTLSLGDLRGEPVLLNLWATWCAPCIAEMPTLDALAEQFDGRVKVLTVSQDLRGQDAVAPFWAQRSFAMLEPWLDPDTQLGKALDGSDLPVTIYFDRDGKEQWRVQGGYDWASEEAQALIEESIGG